MGYKELLDKNLIKPFKAQGQQVRKQMELARRDLKEDEAKQSLEFAKRFFGKIEEALKEIR